MNNLEKEKREAPEKIIKNDPQKNTPKKRKKTK